MTFSGSESFIDTPTPGAGRASGLFFVGAAGRTHPGTHAEGVRRLEVSGHGSRKLDLHASSERSTWRRVHGSEVTCMRYRHLPSDFFARNSVCSNICSCTIGTCCHLSIKSRDDRWEAEQTDKAWGMAGEAAVASAKKSQPSKAIYAASKSRDRYRRRHVRQGIRRQGADGASSPASCPQFPPSVLACCCRHEQAAELPLAP